ncbi:MAG: bifunctional adenosylcobinamide kinase/adenosylcobinamide-phosphate guanylyltransferase [Bacteroidota bacterium]|nr:bifunctional adenosylcobinamide kinase/adenosylcobinamide-phosphate guanylyltransferase [Bacteroidota bacterium]
MAHIIYISGGERSGKSNFAQNSALNISDRPVYLATARVWDDDFALRIERHKNERDERWENLEEEKHLSRHNLTGKTVVLDCVTLWLTNIFSDNQFDFEKSLSDAKEEWNKFINQNFTLIVVSNEIGMGLHATSEGGRKFVELQGRMNQYIANLANEAHFMVSGISIKIK